MNFVECEFIEYSKPQPCGLPKLNNNVPNGTVVEKKKKLTKNCLLY